MTHPRCLPKHNWQFFLAWLAIFLLAAAPALAETLFGVAVWDPMTLGAVGGGVLLLSALAAFLPARTAASLHPGEALRDE